MKKKAALSWSGGKDSCMALERLERGGEYEVSCLLTTVPQEIGRTFGHGERLELIRAQADALGLPVEFISCSFESYTEDYVRSLLEAKAKYRLSAVAYGDLFLAEHREWGTGVAKKAELEAVYPLWMAPSAEGVAPGTAPAAWNEREATRQGLLRFVESGYRAIVIRVKDNALSADWLGRELDRSFYEDILRLSEVCPMGEGGEYHTFVYDGPLFQWPVVFERGETRQLETTKRLEIGTV
ncbi:hypothetical protein ACFPVX_09380 [Cohnella faecalis]|uniref:Adenine nucleotide alpha hydrolase n=1 Tax=Cohnella faecalis TaxID=2315694 RepID=A0A398CHU4_9BACL|nr:adenine nucleotide alpha hydrolase [Cohnella faecalis]RIE01905.1 adenine nucleotide alpha hydrolase [Cohnella faecalis]